MKTLEKITKTALISLLFLQLSAYEVLGETCPCTFNTTTYSAVAEGDGYCTSTTKDGKDCSITFNGRVEQKRAAGIEPSSIYGPMNQYIAQMRAVNDQLYKPQYFLAAQDPNWLIKSLPLMIRSGYATVEFLSHAEREKLDFLLNEFFKRYGKEVYAAVIGKEKAFSKEMFEVSKGKVKFSVDKTLVVFFAISIPEGF